MSYEGYVQFICENGHLYSMDCYNLSDTTCPECNARAAWENSVDLTNGSHCDCDAGLDLSKNDCQLFSKLPHCKYCDRGRIDGYVQLKLDQPAVYEECPCCGSRKRLKAETYKIPKNKGRKLK